MVVGSPNNEYYPIEQLCSITRKFISAQIPSGFRYLDNNIWWVHKSWVAMVLKKAKDSGNHTILDYDKVDVELKASLNNILNNKRKPIVPSVKKDSPYAILHLQEDAPKELVEAAFKVMAKLTHPDVAKSDGSEFRRVKEAYDTIITLRNKVS